MSRGYGQAVAGGNGKKDGGAKDSAHHSEKEDGRMFGVEIRVDDFGADGVGNARANRDGAGKLGEGGNEDGLLHGEAARGNGRGE